MKRLCTILALYIISIVSLTASHNTLLSEPYDLLETVLPFNNHGWYLNGSCIEKLFQNNKISKVIEVGSWLGLSTRHIASLLPENGLLYAVDTWKGSIETDYLQEFMPTLYEQFLSNIIHAGLTHKVKPIRMDSVRASDFLKSEIGHIDLIYLDAAHDTESVLQDLHAYYPFIEQNNCVLCGDDWGWDSVKQAVRIFAKEHNLTIYYDNNFWFLKKINEQNNDTVWHIL